MIKTRISKANNGTSNMLTNLRSEKAESIESIYSVCTKKALLSIAKTIGIAPTSKVSREQLIKQIDATRSRITLKREDLLSPFKPFLSAINREISQATISSREQDLVKEKFLEIFGSSLSRLPYLATKTMPNKKDWIAVQTIAMNLELPYGLLGTSPICKPGIVLSYNPNAHEGPSRLEAGRDCITISTGIQRGESILLKALVITTEGK